VIQSLKDADTQQLFAARTYRRLSGIANVALRKLDQIEASISLSDLRIPPADRLKALRDDRVGQHRIRINDQYRVYYQKGEPPALPGWQ
jgi:proteic killer suppression protein